MHKWCLSLLLLVSAAGAPADRCYQQLSTNSPAATHVCVVRNDGQLSCGFGYTTELGTANAMDDLNLEGNENERGGDYSFPFAFFEQRIADELWTDELFPVLNLNEGVVKVTVAEEASCALLVTGRAICWGLDYESGRLGTNGVGVAYDTISPPSVEVTQSVVPGNITDICIGYQFGCAVLSTGQVRCWGYNDDGNLGDGTTTPHSGGVFVSGISDAVGITCGQWTACAWTDDGVLYCWGEDGDFQVPDSDNTDNLSPFLVSSIPEKVVDAAISYVTGCAVTESGKLYCWGDDEINSLFGSLPNAIQPTPVQVNIPSNVVKVVMAGYHAAALTDMGEVYVWGVNSALGLGYHPYDTAMLYLPRKVNPRYFYGKRVVDIAVRNDQWFQYSGPVSQYPEYPSGGIMFLTEDDKLFYTGVKNRLQAEPVPVEYCPSARMDCQDQSKGKKGKKKQQWMMVFGAVAGVMMVGLAVRYRRRQRPTGAVGIKPTPTI